MVRLNYEMARLKALNKEGKITCLSFVNYNINELREYVYVSFKIPLIKINEVKE